MIGLRRQPVHHAEVADGGGGTGVRFRDRLQGRLRFLQGEDGRVRLAEAEVGAGFLGLVNGEVAFVIGVVGRLRAQPGHDREGGVGVPDRFAESAREPVGAGEVEVGDRQVVGYDAVLGLLLQRRPGKVERAPAGRDRARPVALVDEMLADEGLGEPDGALDAKVARRFLRDFFAEREGSLEILQPGSIITGGCFRFTKDAQKARLGFLKGDVCGFPGLEIVDNGERFVEKAEGFLRLGVEGRDGAVIDQDNGQLVLELS